eukprot:scaffold38071_cov107-Isochrysis_galbana.AAC.1
MHTDAPDGTIRYNARRDAAAAAWPHAQPLASGNIAGNSKSSSKRIAVGQLARLFLCTGPVPAFAAGIQRTSMNQMLPLFVLEVGREGIQVSPPLRVGHVAEEAAKHFGAVGRETQQRLSHLWVAGGGGGRRDRRYGPGTNRGLGADRKLTARRSREPAGCASHRLTAKRDAIPERHAAAAAARGFGATSPRHQHLSGMSLSRLTCSTRATSIVPKIARKHSVFSGVSSRGRKASTSAASSEEDIWPPATVSRAVAPRDLS